MHTQLTILERLERVFSHPGWQYTSLTMMPVRRLPFRPVPDPRRDR